MIAVDDAMSLTRANITGWGKTDIENNFFKEVGLDRIISQTKEARMAGAMQRTLTDLLLSRHAPLKVGSGGNNPSVIQPFRLVPRRNRVNPGYFRISAGVATGGGAPAAHWTITVNNGSLDADSSPFAKSPNNVLKNIEKYFLPGHYITVEFVTDAGAKVTSTCRVISATNVNANVATVVIAPNKTYTNDSAFGGNNSGGNGWYEVASAGEKAVYNPIKGIVKLQANSVSDFESYAHALPGHNEYGLVEYWQQTSRWTHKYNDEYVKALKAATTSEGLKKFRTLDLAKLRAQQEKVMDDAFYETCFFGDEINEKQTTSDWQNLPKVYDPAWASSGESGSLHLEYRSNTLGIRTQINRCGNVLDSQNGPLDLDALFEAGYYVKRERQGESSQEVTEIDVMTDLRFTRPILRQLMVQYYKRKYGIDNVTAFMQQNKEITFNGMVMWKYDSYDLPDYGYTLNVFSDEYFDDKNAQFVADRKSVV